MFFNAYKMWKKAEKARIKKLKEQNKSITFAKEKYRIIKQITSAASEGKNLTIISYPNNGIEDPIMDIVQEIKYWFRSRGFTVCSYSCWSHIDVHISWKKLDKKF